VTEPAPAPALPPDEGWRRTSPISFVVGAVMALRSAALPVAAGLVGTGAWRQGALYLVPSLLLMLGFAGLFSWLAWRNFRYCVGDSDIRVERGLLSRSARSVPYERSQDVSLEQSLVPRLFGMVDVKFETGAGGKDEVRIRYVTMAEAEALRETVRARKTGTVVESVEGGEVPTQAPGRLLFAMDLKRLLTFGLFEFSLVVFAVLGGAAQQFDFLLPFDIWDFRAWSGQLAGPGHWLQDLGIATQLLGGILALALLALVGLATGLGRTVLRDYGFRLEETPKGLRRRRGLLSRTDVVMPTHRIQALTLTTGWLRRRFGWHGLSVVSLATDAKSGNHVVVPFAQVEEIAPVVAETGFQLPDEALDWRRSSARHRVDQALLGAIPLALAAVAVAAIAPRVGAPATWTTLITLGLALLAALTVLRENFLWRHDRHALDVRHLFARHGWLAPHLAIASRLKLQSVEIVQGPLARRRGYAVLNLGLAGGTMAIAGLSLAEAQQLRAQLLDSMAGVDFSRLDDSA
jgi:putative membrane protein